jgi:hypothetical protein
VRILLESSGKLLDITWSLNLELMLLDTRHRLIGATLATSLIRSGSNRKPNREEWISVIEGLDDPYIRAVLRRVGGDSWETVLREGGKEGLDLGDRVIIAVNNLSDTDVSNVLSVGIRADTSSCLNSYTRSTPPLWTSLLPQYFLPPSPFSA